MRPCLKCHWKFAASVELGKTKTGSRGWTDMKAVRIVGGMVVKWLGWCLCWRGIRGVEWSLYTVSDIQILTVLISGEDASTTNTMEIGADQIHGGQVDERSEVIVVRELFLTYHFCPQVYSSSFRSRNPASSHPNFVV